MNIHIELVKKWLDNPDSVTQEELRANAAYAASAVYAANAAADARSADAEYWVELYEELPEQGE